MIFSDDFVAILCYHSGKFGLLPACLNLAWPELRTLGRKDIPDGGKSVEQGQQQDSAAP